MEASELLDQAEELKDRKMGTIVATSVAVLAVFMGIFKVKDDNICQAMQQAQADRIDNWGWYQAHKTRFEVAQATVSSLQSMPPSTERDVQLKAWQTTVDKQKGEGEDVKKKAEDAEKTYDDWNFRDDQFDMADSTLSVSIAILAVTALTNKKFLLVIGFLFATAGLIFGLSGMFGGRIHPGALAKFLGT